MKELRVIIDAGHGGLQGPGAASDYATEIEVITPIASALLHILNHRSDNIVILQTPRGTSSDQAEDLGRRAHTANALDAHCLVSIHANFFEDSVVSGFEVFTSRGYTRADELADEVIGSILRSNIYTRFGFGLRSDKHDGDLDKEAGFQILGQTTMPAILIELGFISNYRDAKALRDPMVQTVYAEAIAEGVLAWAAEEGF